MKIFKKHYVVACSFSLILSLKSHQIDNSAAMNCDGIFHYVDFDESMKTTQFPDALLATERIMGIKGEVLLDFFRQLYLKNITSICNNTVYTSQHSPEPIIPKIIHQIWVGSSFPTHVFEKYQQTWIKMHTNRGWEYRLWTDAEVSKIQLINQVYYDEAIAQQQYGAAADILRWEIIYRFGGVYVDMDYECLRSLDIFHYSYEFYTALQPLDTYFVQLGAALFGARPGHPILKHCIDTIKDDWHKKGAPTKTGPVHFTKSFYAMAGESNSKDIAFPAGYFYPLGSRDCVINRAKWLQDGAYAVHHWAKSWMPAKYRPREFKAINNDHQTKNWNE